MCRLSDGRSQIWSTAHPPLLIAPYLRRHVTRDIFSPAYSAAKYQDLQSLKSHFDIEIFFFPKPVPSTQNTNPSLPPPPTTMALAPKFAGQRFLGGVSTAGTTAPAVHTLELYLDYVCPFSAKMFNTVYDSVFPLLQEKYAGKVQILFRQQIQPWHPSSTLVHEAGVAVLKLQPTRFWDFSNVSLGRLFYAMASRSLLWCFVVGSREEFVFRPRTLNNAQFRFSKNDVFGNSILTFYVLNARFFSKMQSHSTM